MTTVRILLSTVDQREVAERIAVALVEEKLAACVNILPAATSVYRWKGRVERAAEFLLIIKTVETRVEGLIARVRELHPYETPELVTLGVESGLPAYLDWVSAETGS